MGRTAICRHCKRGRACRPRGLCWGCFYRPGVRDQYGTPDPATSKFARRGIRDFNGSAPLPEPTTTLPGTHERVAVYEGRAERGEAIFHPRDYPHNESDQ
jgi:hypothetical protein